MKKSKFLGLNFGSAEILTKGEQKKVFGGFGYGDWDSAESKKTYKCCYKFDHQNCSTCAKGTCEAQYDRLDC